MRDAVNRLTPLGVMLLALLREGDMHPYEMIRLLRQRHEDRLVTVTNGTVYHTVGRLARCELLTEVGIDRAGNRPERTTYTLTDRGRDAVTDWVRRELARIDRPGEFRVALAEAHNLPARRWSGCSPHVGPLSAPTTPRIATAWPRHGSARSPSST